MKKALSLIMALAMLLTMAVGFNSSAESKNMLAIDEEFDVEIKPDAYVCAFDLIEDDGNPRYPEYILGSWTDVAEGNVAYSFDTETVKFGSKSIKIEVKKIGHTCVLLPVYGIEPGKTYTLSLWVKTQKVLGSWGFSSEVEFQTVKNIGDAQVKATDCVVINGGERITGTKDWMNYTLTFQATASDFTFSSVSLMLWEALGTVWVDGITLVEGETPLAADAEGARPDPATCGGPKPVDSNNKLIGGGTDTPDTPDTPAAPTLNGEPSAWAKEEILKALEADLVPEHVNSNYTTDITRSDFCDLIIKMIEKKSGKAIADVIAGYADAKSDVSFPDTDSANVIAAAKLGIVNGRSSGAFDPSANITRQEAAKMLALAAKVLGADITASEVAFADADDIYAWAKEFIYYVNTIGVMNGTSTTTPPNFSPLRTYTREQSILTVYRLFNAL
ncbi:MAG: hypothetical protein E7491_08230 [Ruminococcaceae bacterium]|nr:hypothetical protein [Oscillospiraceae bacterium]